MRDPSWMQLSARFRNPPPPPAPVAAAGEATVSAAVDVDEEYPYLAAWREYKRIWRAIWINGFAGWLTIAVLIQVLPRIGAEVVADALVPIWGSVWFLGTMVAVLRMVAFSCPRCGATYFSIGRSPALQLKCRSCGLPKFAVNDAGKRLYQLKPPKD
jgi:hypothetical protein